MFKSILLTLLASLSLISNHIWANNSVQEKIQSASVSSPINATQANPLHFIPDGYVLQEQYQGDLNKDGKEDYVLLVKGTDKSKMVMDEYQGAVDRNRRGIIILFKKGNGYEKVVANLGAFSSENEGSTYIKPELRMNIVKGTLHLQYFYGTTILYTSWTHIFRYQNSKFELIGFGGGEYSTSTESTASINFSTQKMLIQDKWYDINFPTLIDLVEMTDFDQLTSDLVDFIDRAK